MAEIRKRWIFLSLIFRFVNAYWQTGYLHPDEYFQSVEVFAADIFDVNTKLPWEFSVANPIRSISTSTFFVGLPMTLYKSMATFLQLELDFMLITLSPRFLAVIFSLVVDLCLYRLCKVFQVNVQETFFIYFTSYPLYTYLLRSFSNAWETFYFSIFLLVVHSSEKCLLRVNLRAAAVEGVLLAVGIFCRPTFPAFVFIPLAAQVLTIFKQSFRRSVTFSSCLTLTFSLTSISCVLGDTLYYKGRLNMVELILSPVNFLLYNFNSDNLRSHTYHPSFTHLLVNLPQLIGPAMCIFYIPVHYYCNQQSGRDLYVFSIFLFPVIALSAFCHQEMRFLLPVFPLACLLFGIMLQRHIRQRSQMLKIWIIFNALLLIFWGYLHQSGVVRALNHARSIQTRPNTCKHFYFFKTYMPPVSLMGVPKDSDLQCFVVHDLASIDPLRIAQETTKLPFERYVIFPNSVYYHLINSELVLDFKACKKFLLHVSTENLPEVITLLTSGATISRRFIDLVNAFSMMFCRVQ